MANSSEAALEEAVVSAGINGPMLQNMLMGMYTILYGGTMYLYAYRNKPNRTIVIAVITLLYILSGIGTIVSWYFSHPITTAASRKQIALAIVDPSPEQLAVFYYFVFFSGLLVSDAFLIWRCYHVWGMSLRVIAVPSVLLIAEAGFLITSTILQSLSRQQTSSAARMGRLSDVITSALMLASLSTTAVTTFLIGYRIHKGTSISGSRSKRSLHFVVTMIAESAAMYSFALVGPVIINIVIPLVSLQDSIRWVAASCYTQIFISIVAGVAPTILVARIAIRDTDTEQTFTLTTPHISELEMGSAPVPGGRNDIAENTDIPGAANPSLGRDQQDTPAKAETGVVGNEGTEKV